MLNTKLFRWGRPLMIVGLGLLFLGILFTQSHWLYGAEMVLAGQIVTGAGVLILILQVISQNKKSSVK